MADWFSEGCRKWLNVGPILGRKKEKLTNKDKEYVTDDGLGFIVFMDYNILY